MRILLVEDNQVNLRVAEFILRGLGYVVDMVGNGKEALGAVAKTKYDAILMDCQMPEMDGYAATIAIRAMEGSGAHTPIIALTAHSEESDLDRCLDAGMDDFLTKPIEPDRLQKTLAAWLS